MVDVLIVGGGVVGAAILRELSRYKLDVLLLEREEDFGWGSTKSNYGLVCQGGDVLEFRKGYKRTALARESIKLMEPLCKELDVPFKRIGKVSLIRNTVELERFIRLKKRAEKEGPPIEPPRLLSKSELYEIEPNVAKGMIGGLLDPMMSIVDPIRLTIALIENAKDNGAEAKTGVEVEGFSLKGSYIEAETSEGKVKARFVINAAGMDADRLARKINADDFVLFPVKGVVGVLDKSMGSLISHEIHALPTAPGEGNMIAPTIHGNILIGLVMRLDKRGDFSVPADMAKKTLENAKKLFPDISQSDIINMFAGFLIFRNYEVGWHECVVRPSRAVPNFIHAVIGFPGVSVAPGCAKEIVRILKSLDLPLEEKENFNLKRKDIPHIQNMDEEKIKELIKKDSRFSHIVCRCEHVSEGEIVEAIKRGAKTLDGIKYRTRAGMGRCQGGFCTPRVVRILARELGIDETAVTRKGKGSELLVARTKELIGEKDGS